MSNRKEFQQQVETAATRLAKTMLDFDSGRATTFFRVGEDDFRIMIERIPGESESALAARKRIEAED